MKKGVGLSPASAKGESDRRTSVDHAMKTPTRPWRQDAERLTQVLRTKRRILAFTGAGISTGSGIPDFRGPQGIWNRIRPVYYDEFLQSHEARVRHWEYKLQGWTQFRDAVPNPAHRALVRLDEMGVLAAVVTQNIDGLHELAGHRPEKIVELHGTNRWVECCSCGERSEPANHFSGFEKTHAPPICRCGGFLKSATVSFGQAMPMDKMARAIDLAGNCDAVIAIGSTLEVEPAASIPRHARGAGAFYAIINLGPTAQDRLADMRLEGDAAQILPWVVENLSESPTASPN